MTHRHTDTQGRISPTLTLQLRLTRNHFQGRLFTSDNLSQSLKFYFLSLPAKWLKSWNFFKCSQYFVTVSYLLWYNIHPWLWAGAGVVRVRCEAIIYSVWRQDSEAIYPGQGESTLEEHFIWYIDHLPVEYFNFFVFRTWREGSGENTSWWQFYESCSVSYLPFYSYLPYCYTLIL